MALFNKTADHEYVIHIRRELSEDAGNNIDSNYEVNSNWNSNKPNLVDKVKGKDKKSSTASVGIAALSISVGKSYLQYGLSNVGKWTGNKNKQSIVNGTMELASMSAMALVNWQASLAVIAIKAGTTLIDGKYDNYIESARSTRSLQRAGYSSVDEVIGVRH